MELDRFDGRAKAFCFWVRGPRRGLQKFNCFVHEIISISVQKKYAQLQLVSMSSVNSYLKDVGFSLSLEQT